MSRYLLIIFIILQSHALFGQNTLTGQVKDLQLDLPIQYVSIYLDNSVVGTSTDKNGFFSIELPSPNVLDSVNFQLIGYRSQKLSLPQLKNNQIVYLALDEQEIDEVTIQAKNAYELVQEALRKIPDNYYANPLGQEFFYRQSLVTNGELNIIEEGSYHILNTFQRKKIPNNVVVKKARAYIDMSMYEQLGKIVAKNLVDDSVYIAQTAESVLVFNPNLTDLQADKQGIFGENAFKNYSYNYLGLNTVGGHTVYMISFDQKEDVKKTLYTGMMYIDTASMAITWIRAGLSPQGIDLQKFLPLKFRMLAKLLGFSIYIQGISFEARYEKQDKFWVIAAGGFNLEASVSRRKGEVLNGNLSLDYKSIKNFSKTDFYNVKSSYNVIPSSLKEFKDEDFWGGEFFPQFDVQLNDALLNAIKDL